MGSEIAAGCFGLICIAGIVIIIIVATSGVDGVDDVDTSTSTPTTAPAPAPTPTPAPPQPPTQPHTHQHKTKHENKHKQQHEHNQQNKRQEHNTNEHKNKNKKFIFFTQHYYMLYNQTLSSLQPYSVQFDLPRRIFYSFHLFFNQNLDGLVRGSAKKKTSPPPPQTNHDQANSTALFAARPTIFSFSANTVTTSVHQHTN